MQEKEKFFRELMWAGHGLHAGVLDANFTLVASNADAPDKMAGLLPLMDLPEQVSDLWTEQDTPVALTNELGLMLILSRDAAGYYHILGPAFYDAVSFAELEQSARLKVLNIADRRQTLEALHHLPLLSTSLLVSCAVQQHYMLTGQRLQAALIRFVHSAHGAEEEAAEPMRTRGLYAAEQAMLKMIENGVLAFHEEHDRLAALGNTEYMGFGSPMRQNKDLLIILSSLASHAAINGGVLPEIAQDLSNRYIREIEQAGDLYELTEINRRMLLDYTTRVHQEKIAGGMSPQIKSCCDYIQLHVDQRTTVETLASYVGYSEKYVSRKFLEETGKTIGTYITEAKVERAKLLLRDSSLSPSDIAIALGFSSQSHFGVVFKKVTGMTPGAYRRG